jgi:hypothetical protein
MSWKRLFGIADIAVVLMVMVGCSERVPTNPPIIKEQVGIGLAVTDGITAVEGHEWIADTFIRNGETGWGATRFDQPSFTVTTWSGYWYNFALIRDGLPMYSGWTFGGVALQDTWMDENTGIWFSANVMVSNENQPVIWQWGSNLDSLVVQTVEILNWTTHTNLRFVGTPSCYSSLAPPLVRDGATNRYTAQFRSPTGDLKIAVINGDTGLGLGDSVTVRVNNVELNSFDPIFTHPRWPVLHTYFRYHVAPNGTVTPLGTEDRWTYGNTLRVTNSQVSSTAVLSVNADFTQGQSWPMTYIGNNTWERTGISTWVGPQTLQVVVDNGDRIFRTVQWNGHELHHLTILPLVPPIQAFLFTPPSDRNLDVGQGAYNLVVDIGVHQP